MLVRRFSLVAFALTAACAETAAPAKPADTASGAQDATAAADSAADTTAADSAKLAETALPDVKSSDAVKDVSKVVPCADRAGGYVVDGQCSNGAQSIPYACMLVKGCDLTWETDFRDWSGPLTGNDYALANAGKTDTITGTFTGETTGKYTYKGGSLTCEATMEKFESTFASDICCSVTGQACSQPDTACVPIQDSAGPVNIVTTGCVPLAQAATTEGAPCSAAPGKLTCKAGLICSKDGGAADKDAGHCKKLCVAKTDCGQGQACVIVTGAPKSGVCAPVCSPFAELGSAGGCKAGETCAATAVSDGKGERGIGGECVASDDGKEGASCSSGSGCANGLACVDKKCAPYCDNGHPCKSGSCTNFGLPNGPDVGAGFGYCK